MKKLLIVDSDKKLFQEKFSLFRSFDTEEEFDWSVLQFYSLPSCLEVLELNTNNISQKNLQFFGKSAQKFFP